MNFIALDEAAKLLPAATRILVIGCSGSGKSTLAAKLAQRLRLRHISMDKEFFWLPGWVLRDRAEISRLVTEAVAMDCWIMDGTSPRTMPIRLPRAQMVIWMRPPRLVSFYGLFRRVLKYHGTVRPEMAAGCPEPLPDEQFLSFIWNFEKHSAPKVLAMLAQHGPDVPILQLKSYAAASQLLALLREGH